MPNRTAQAAYLDFGVHGFRNLLINGDFRIAQRSTSASGTSGYLSLDRWTAGSLGASATISQQAHTVGQTDVPGASHFMRVAFGAAASGNVRQKIEDLQQFFGRSHATLSFYAKADSACTLTWFLQQDFGSGGSSAVNTDSQGASLTTSWQRFTLTFALASMSGKTFGTAHCLSAIFNEINGRQIDLSHVQLEHGQVATPFDGRPIGVELLLCRRYYYKTDTMTFLYNSAHAAANALGWTFNHPTAMRTAPTMAIATSFTLNNCSSQSIDNVTSTKADLLVNVAAANFYNAASGVITGSAEL